MGAFVGKPGHTGVMVGLEGTSKVSVTGSVSGEGDSIKANCVVNVDPLLTNGEGIVYVDKEERWKITLADREIIESKSYTVSEATLLSW